MNTQDAFALLSDIFREYTFHIRFIEEMSSLLKKDLKGKEAAFFQCLAIQMNYIKTLGNMVHTADGHELLRWTDGIYYSIHLQQAQFNVRLLIHIGDDGTPFFLCAFNEKSGHRSTNYQKYTAVLSKRLNEILEEDNHE